MITPEQIDELSAALATMGLHVLPRDTAFFQAILQQWVARCVTVAVDETLAKHAIDALRALMTNPCINLADQIYSVREREGQGWDGQAVKAWSAAVFAAEDVLKLAERETQRSSASEKP